MAVLKQVFPQLAEELGKIEDEQSIEGKLSEEDLKIESAVSGAPTLICRGLYVHSKRDPEREAQRLVDGASGSDCASPALLLGFGLGYTAFALAAKYPGRPIIIVEKHPKILKKALESRDLEAFFSKNRLIFVLGGDGGGLNAALSLFEWEAGVFPLVIQNRTLCALDEEWYADLEDRLRTWNTQTNVNRSTLKRFGKRWVRNFSKNLKAVRDFPGISRLEGLLSQTNIPVFLAAAGPSLDAAAPMLEEIRKRCLIVAVDTSLRFLQSRGINSDFVVSVDPQYWNYRHLDQVPASKTRLVTESAVYPPLLRHCFGGVLLCASFFPLGRFIEERVDPKGGLGAGGSVATSAWDFCRLLGARQIWIAGLDLSFPEFKTHFRGASFEEKFHAASGRLFTGETWNFRYLRDGQPFRLKQRGGGTVLTDKRLSLYASWFENRFNRFPDIKNYSFSASGLELKGLESAPEQDFLTLPDRRDEIDQLLADSFQLIERDFSSEEAGRAEKYKNALETLLNGLEKVKNLAADAAQMAKRAAAQNKLGHLQEAEREKTLLRLDAANQAITKSEVKEIAGFLFPEIEGWEAEIAAATRDPLVRHLEFSARFYSALAEAADYTARRLSLQ